MAKSVDEILEEIGQLGRFQISRLAVFCIIIFPPTFQEFNMFYIGAEPPWRCTVNSTRCILNGTFVAGDENYDFRCKLNRSDWEFAPYDGPRTSVVTEFDLVCGDAFYAWLGKSMEYIGTSCFTIQLGMLSDRYGRLVSLFPSLIIIIVVGFASSFTTQYWQFLLTRFIMGAFSYGVFFPIVILSGEFVGPRYRSLSQTVVWFSFTFTLLLMSCMAYYVREWRTLMIICTAPWIFVVVFWKFIPESTRWYLAHNKVEKAEDTLREIARVNKKEYPNERLLVPQTQATSLGCFSTCSLAISTFIQAFAWFVNGMVYYGASYGASELGGSMYLNFALTSLVEIPADILVIDNCERFGRKKTVIAHMVLSGAACSVVSFIPGGTGRTDYIVGRVIGGILVKGFITVSYDSFHVWSSEIFPTVVRNSGMGFLGVMTCLGAVTAPFVVQAKRINTMLPYGIMGALAVIAALVCLVLPETRGKPTAEIIESKSKKGGKGILSCTDDNNDYGSIQARSADC